MAGGWLLFFWQLPNISCPTMISMQWIKVQPHKWQKLGTLEVGVKLLRRDSFRMFSLSSGRQAVGLAIFFRSTRPAKLWNWSCPGWWAKRQSEYFPITKHRLFGACSKPSKQETHGYHHLHTICISFCFRSHYRNPSFQVRKQRPDWVWFQSGWEIWPRSPSGSRFETVEVGCFVLSFVSGVFRHVWLWRPKMGRSRWRRMCFLLVPKCCWWKKSG